MIEEKPSLHVHIGHDVRILALVGVCVNRIGKVCSLVYAAYQSSIAEKFKYQSWPLYNELLVDAGVAIPSGLLLMGTSKNTPTIFDLLESR